MKNDLHDTPSPDKKTLREFGLTTGGIIAILFGLLFPWIFKRPFPVWPRTVAAVLILWALAAPAALSVVYSKWMKLGSLMNRITMPIVLGIIYLMVVTPAGFVLRLRGKDPLSRKFETGAQSYRVPSRKIITKNMERPF